MNKEGPPTGKHNDSSVVGGPMYLGRIQQNTLKSKAKPGTVVHAYSLRYRGDIGGWRSEVGPG
jgi:hypothetical protein